MRSILIWVNYNPGFDKALPDGVEFTLTLGKTEFDSSDVSSGGGGKLQVGGRAPSWSDGEAVAVRLDFTTPVVFREGATLLGAFTTPTMPPTLAFETK